MTLELADVTKIVGGVTHIKPTNLRFEAGHFNVLLGATGAGKTSLIKLMAGLDKVAGGTITLNGRDVTKASPQKRNIALVHQFFVNYPHMSVYDNIASPLKVAGMARSEIQGRVEEAADILQLRSQLKKYPHELSGGQQQRTALARAIAKEAQAVFLDEPLANLDYKLREELREQLPELFAGRGAIVIYATSEPEEALMLGGVTALVDDGQVTQTGPTAEVYRAPRDLSSARVFSNPPINAAAVTKQGDMIMLGAHACWSAVGAAAGLAEGDYTVAIRPHHISPVLTREATVALSGVVEVTELSGSDSSAHFRVGDEAWVSLAQGVHPYRIGAVRDFYFDPMDCLYFAPDGARAG
jgi:glycerol transport system ATP-binding protein